jgi:hypothetical protein
MGVDTLNRFCAAKYHILSSRRLYFAIDNFYPHDWRAKSWE